jgi:YVTN family beta-propeller protein
MSPRAALLAAVFAAMPGISFAADPGIELPSGQFITPTAAPGASFATLNPGLKDHPAYRAGQAVKAVVSPDGTTLLVLTSGYNNLNYTTGPNAGGLEPSASTEYVFVYDITSGHQAKPALTQVIQVPNSYVGLVFAPGGSTFYVSAGVNDAVLAYSLANGVWSLSADISLGHPAGLGFQQSTSVAGLALSASGKLLATANIYNDSISIVDTVAGKIIADYDLRPYNTTPATGNGVAGGETPFSVAIKGETTLYVSSIRDREIVVLDISAVPTGGAPTLIARIPVSGNPNSLLLSNDAAQSRLYVAEDNSDSVAVISTASNKRIEEIPAAAPPGLLTGEHYPGAAPNGLALSPDGNLLYVTEGGADAVAVVAVGGNQLHQVWGLIPTGWYPNSVAVGLAGDYLYVVNGKSLPGPNPFNPGDNTGARPNSHNQYIYQLEQAGLLALPTPAPSDLPALTKQVAANNNWTTLPSGHDQAVMAALHNRIHHVIYIVKENRTFDEVLGDLRNGSNGNPGLALFGRRLTPNFHRISTDFVTLDNFYCAGEVSGDGWHWSCMGQTGGLRTRPVSIFMTPIICRQITGAWNGRG